MFSSAFRPRSLLLAAVAACLVGAATAAETAKPWPANAFQPVTLQRIETLPAEQQGAWKFYFERSERLKAALLAEFAKYKEQTAPAGSPSKGGAKTYGLRLDLDPSWYGSTEARQIADRIIKAQSVVGGWTKGMDYRRDDPAAGHKPDSWSYGTFDNDATITELRFLARVAATVDKDGGPWGAAFLRGLDYCFAAQYPNGGFPQIFPLAGGYHDNITYNDGAMVHILQLLREVAQGGDAYGFVPEAKRVEAAKRLVLGIRCILASQVKTEDGRLCAWDQQHDAITLKPAAARNFEPISVCTSESSELVMLLMGLPKPSPEIIRSVDAAVAWFQKVAIKDTEWSNRSNKGLPVASKGAEPIWARLYEPESDRPVFGDRDKVVHFSLEEVSLERRTGYAWYGRWPEKVLTKYPVWKKKLEDAAKKGK